MPFRHAHRWLLLLAPAILLAFAPGYWSQLGTVPAALHLHGLVASAWVALLWYQSWTAQTRRLQVHRLAGRAVFVLVPLFAAAGLLVIQGMARFGLDAADPFHARFGTRLALEDLLSLAGFLTLAGWAIARRRRLVEHASAMLATVLLLLPPVIGRIIPIATAGLSAQLDQHPFTLGFHLAQIVTIAACLRLARRHGRPGRPFLLVAVVLAAESVLFETVARSAAWTDLARGIAATPSAPLIVAGLLAGALTIVPAWSAGARPAPRVLRQGLT